MAISDIGKTLLKIFGSRNERLLKKYWQVALSAGQFEEKLRSLTDEQLSAKTGQFKAALNAGSRPEDILPEAFAVVRETARRTIGLRHFDVQLIGGLVLYEGKIAEMVTGEGKTLVATLATYMVHLTGRHVHLVTVNDYLAKRDAEWMGPVYKALGLSVGVIQADMDTIGEERKAQYACDITYGTNNEFGFDYLRDNMKVSLEQMVQGELQYAIVDEVDSILVDEARTPLIISGPALDDVSRYKKADAVARKLLELQSSYDRTKKQIDAAERIIANAKGEIADSKKDSDNTRIAKAQKVIDTTGEELESARARLETMTQYYEVEFDRKAIRIGHEGMGAAQEAAGIGSFFTGSNMEWPHLLEQSLRAHVVFEKEKDYVVMDGKIIIVDEFTGRLMHGRQWSDGLHQAVEAKENVQVKEETQTLATITLQNFFKLYKQISGMTGTAATEAEEFMSIYKLEVVVIPTNQPCIREDLEDMIYKTMREKFAAITEEINQISSEGRPVLVGTISIEKSEALSEALTKKYGVEHEVLNAKQHAREALIVAKAGQQHPGRDGAPCGNVTIATNMAGRGTDIKLGPGVANIGGLHILGTERHEARRIDNQLRGRSGRQGDAGSSQFFLSFDDDLIRTFAPEWTIKALAWIGWEEGQPIIHKRISKGIERAQKKVEERNFEIRKHLLEYDEVMDYQRKIFYSRRRQILSGKGLKPIIEEMIESAAKKATATILNKNYPVKCIIEWSKTNFGIELKDSDIEGHEADEIEEIIKQKAKDNAASNISVSLGEYLEDFENPDSWQLQDLCKWAMSAYSVTLSPNKLKSLSADQIQEQLTEAAAEQLDKKDCAPVSDFLKPDFALKTFIEWARAKFDISISLDQMKNLDGEQMEKLVLEKTAEKYRRREVEYPVEFAMNMVFGPQGPNIYGIEALSKWANKKFEAGISTEDIQSLKPSILYNRLLELSEKLNNDRLKEMVDSKAGSLETSQLIQWANERFNASFTDRTIGQGEERNRKILEAAREFLREELSDLERYVLLQVYDSAWKDHLYVMDHLKEGIGLRALAEQDPKTEYKREGFKLFEEMLETIEDRVTDIIFKVRLEAGARTKSVWNVSSTAHDEVGQFALAERQRAAAQAPQGETQVKQIVLEKPKVGRNDPCPCGSGKKYKKCHGKNA
jgi:preprotein translocase subunit SecA